MRRGAQFPEEVLFLSYLSCPGYRFGNIFGNAYGH